MANLYLTEQNSILRKTGDRLIVQKDDETLLDVQCHKIDAVLIFGNVQFTTQAVHELFEHGIEMAILTRTGKLIGQITSPSTKNIALRLQQFKKYWDNAFRLSLSKSIVEGKIKNALNVIRLFSYNHRELDFGAETSLLKTRLNDVKSATQIDQLFGLEGSAARTYFDAFSKMLLDTFGFPGRKKHPSTDPVNALLSFSYTMIFNEISSLLDGLGFDPYLAYYHSIDYGRMSLASDLMEDFGDRVQYSVFECILDGDLLDKMMDRIHKIISAEADSVRVYALCAKCEGIIKVIGQGKVTKNEDVYIV